jgi:anti-sigma regulatory factor (Ser/Thr protein kinase)
MLPIYSQKSKIKLLILVVALIISVATVIYTNILVHKLAKREEQLIDLYAKGLEYASNSKSDENLVFILEEIIGVNKSVPVILTNAKEQVEGYSNVYPPANISKHRLNIWLKNQIEEMKSQHEPIVVKYGRNAKSYIFYKDSEELTQLRYYPYVQLTVMACFSLMAYFAFSYSRKAEQNRVWVGLAKETAHQLGTPLSSLMAWYEYLKVSPKFENEPIVEELGKDVKRLEIITERFSNIGSVPALKDENILRVTENAISYLQHRVSKKVAFSVKAEFPADTPAKVNIPLFEWVIENICKNAIDAMDGIGRIDVTLCYAGKQQVAIDIKDSGKGISKSKLDEVFTPGYTTKKRGWGLGLALARRIIENYHRGKLNVKWSEVGKGTTFRILLNR